METQTLINLVTTTLDDHKAIDIKYIDVTDMTDIIDGMIIASGTSTRHVKSLADKVIEAAKKAGERPLGTEGENTGEWVLIDLTDIVVHIMLPEQREFYNLEKLWMATETLRNAS